MRSQIFRRVILAVLVVALLAAVVPAAHYYSYLSTHVSTDDAYVDGTIALVSSRVAGTITAVYVEDNWMVKGGQLLLELDPRDFQIRAAQARAQLDRAEQSVDELYAEVDAAQSGIKLVQSQLNQARIDYDRAKQLKNQGVVSAEQYDQAETGLRIAVANEALAEHQLTQAQAALGKESSEDHSRYDRPIVKQAEAALEAADLDLSYTRITAPFTGIVTRKTAHIGNRVQVGEPLMAVVPTHNLYFIANFKETQLTDVRVGQKAEVSADIYPDFVYQGHIDSISMGTGAAFSLLPPENATGNWVKVVQRVPVKIVLDQPAPADKPLRLGLSVEVSVDISDTRGPLLTSLVQEHYQHGSEVVPNEQLNLPNPAEPAPVSENNGKRSLLRRFLGGAQH